MLFVTLICSLITKMQGKPILFLDQLMQLPFSIFLVFQFSYLNVSFLYCWCQLMHILLDRSTHTTTHLSLIKLNPRSQFPSFLLSLSCFQNSHLATFYSYLIYLVRILLLIYIFRIIIVVLFLVREAIFQAGFMEMFSINSVIGIYQFLKYCTLAFTLIG